MYTVCETTLFNKLYPDYWTEDEYNEFKVFIASNPEAGDVEPNAGGIRKIRWGASHIGKRGGVRIIYYNRLANGQIWLLTIYGKSAVTQLKKSLLKQLVEKLNGTFK
ncbi:transcriptional regulator [Candidatus Nitrosacidococcus sp. I8]|uniref:transcriptional regulator n=1 Tax=Candidatus Nitrosacidococcus sp. I8 TaxID=2942908 RepID=UPI00222604A3|nr:transcriptional regulator [Candidatus Nitrosacidococcus sp. I8]CAH9018753.1 Toxin HigB-2 [Candidatus Nitrosacidococcus sp. I8]